MVWKQIREAKTALYEAPLRVEACLSFVPPIFLTV